MLRNIETFITENLQTFKNNLLQDILIFGYSDTFRPDLLQSSSSFV